jgi:hypothetical protein
VQDGAAVGDHSKPDHVPAGVSEWRSLIKALDRQVERVACLGQIRYVARGPSSALTDQALSQLDICCYIQLCSMRRTSSTSRRIS